MNNPRFRLRILLKTLLEQRSLTQCDLADLLRVDKQTVRRLYWGRVRLSGEAALKLEDVFGLKAEQFLILQAYDDCAVAREKREPGSSANVVEFPSFALEQGG